MVRRGLSALLAIAAASVVAGSAHAERPLAVSEMDYRLIEGPANSDTIVLIHGLGSTQHTFNRVAAELSRKYSVLIYDQRGHGRSATRGDDYSTELLARDLKVLHDHLGLGKVHLLGHSLGGRTAVRYASMFPGDVQSLIVEDMELLPWKYTEKQQRGIARLADALRDFPETFASREEAARSLTPLMEGKTREEKIAQAQAIVDRKTEPLPDGRVRLLYSPYANHLYLYQARGEDLGPALAAIQAPVLFISADEKEPIITRAGRAHLGRHRPGAPFVRIRGSGHAIHRSHMDEFIAVVDRFLSEDVRAANGAGAPPTRAQRPSAGPFPTAGQQRKARGSRRAPARRPRARASRRR
jgi:esterase